MPCCLQKMLPAENVECCNLFSSSHCLLHRRRYSISWTLRAKHTQHHTAAQRSTAHSTAQHSTAQHSTAQHSTAQHSTAQHSTAQHSTAWHTAAQHSTVNHSTVHHRRAWLTQDAGIHRLKCPRIVTNAVMAPQALVTD